MRGGHQMCIDSEVRIKFFSIIINFNNFNNNINFNNI